jgi:peptide/nickel transport system permease protein
MGRCFGNLNFCLGFALCAVVVCMAAVSLFWTPYGPTAMDARHRMEAPSPDHPLGTDQYGRDLLSRVMVGAVNSIVVGLMTVAIGMGAGVDNG